MRYLSLAEYNAVLSQALRQLGLTEADAQRLISSRWPMTGDALVSEAFGRGLRVDLQTVTDYLTDLMGEPMEGSTTFVGPIAAEGFMAWAIENHRAEPTAVGRRLADDPHGVLPSILRASKAGAN
jgi:hypothetical protein